MGHMRQSEMHTEVKNEPVTRTSPLGEDLGWDRPSGAISTGRQQGGRFGRRGASDPALQWVKTTPTREFLSGSVRFCACGSKPTPGRVWHVCAR